MLTQSIIFNLKEIANRSVFDVALFNYLNHMKEQGFVKKFSPVRERCFDFPQDSGEGILSHKFLVYIEYVNAPKMHEAYEYLDQPEGPGEEFYYPVYSSSINQISSCWRDLD